MVGEEMTGFFDGDGLPVGDDVFVKHTEPIPVPNEPEDVRLVRCPCCAAWFPIVVRERKKENDFA